MLYVRNLTQDITEDALKEEFDRYGTVERVKKIKDYAFVHFEDRDCAVKVRSLVFNMFLIIIFFLDTRSGNSKEQDGFLLSSFSNLILIFFFFKFSK